MTCVAMTYQNHNHEYMLYYAYVVMHSQTTNMKTHNPSASSSVP